MKEVLISNKKFFPLKEVLTRLKIPKDTLFKLIEGGKIEAEEVQGVWYLSEDSFTFLYQESQKELKSSSYSRSVQKHLFKKTGLVFFSICFIFGFAQLTYLYKNQLENSFVFLKTELQKQDVFKKSDFLNAQAHLSAVADFYAPLFEDVKNVPLELTKSLLKVGNYTQEGIQYLGLKIFSSLDIGVNKIVSFSEDLKNTLTTYSIILTREQVSDTYETVSANVISAEEDPKKSMWSKLIGTLSDALVPLFVEKPQVAVVPPVVDAVSVVSEPVKEKKGIMVDQKNITSTSVYTNTVYGVSQNELDTAINRLRLELFNLNLATKTYLNEMRVKQASKIGERTGDSIQNAVENISGSTITNSSATLDGLTVDVSTLVVDSENNRVGISTSSPYTTLTVDGSFALTGGLYDNNASQGSNGYVLQSTGSGVTWVATSSLGISTGGTGGVNSGVAGYFSYYDSNGTTVDDQSVLNISGSNIGIGTTSPYAKLSVAGRVVGEYFTATSTTATSTFMGAVGIGTSNPTKKLSVSGDVSISGTLSLGSNTLRTTSDQLFFGNYAGLSATNSQGSNFFGNNSGSSALDASYSNFFGEESGYQAANAFSSNFLGLSAGWQATNASYSQFIGESSGYQATNASQSIFLGPYAGYQATNAKNSIFIGYGAGTNDTVNNTVSGTSILIGNNASTGGFSNSIGIGRGVMNSSSQQFNIGNVLFGTGIYNSDTPSATPIATGKVGIGTTSPYAKLSVVGQVVGEYFTATSTTATSTFTNTSISQLSLSGKLFDNTASSGTNGYVLQTTGSGVSWVATSSLGLTSGQAGIVESGTSGQVAFFNSSGTTVSGTSTLYVLSGKVGIGTTSPTALLEVGGHTKTNSLSISGGGTYEAGSIYSDANWGMLFRAKQNSPSGAIFRWSDSSDTEQFRISTLGNMLVGTTTGTAKLSVSGDGYFYGDISNVSANQTRVNITSNGTGSSALAAVKLTNNSSGAILEQLSYGSANNGSSWFGLNTANALFSLAYGGSLTGYGIGTITSDPVIIGTNNTSRLYISATGTIGMGTDSPSSSLHIRKDQNSGNSITVENRSASGSAYSSILASNGSNLFEYGILGTGYSTNGLFRQNGAFLNANSTAGMSFISQAGAIRFGTGGFADTNERLTIETSGNIGIGTTTPYAKLSVVGQVVASHFTATSTTATSTFAGRVGVGTTTNSLSSRLTVENIGYSPFQSVAGLYSYGTNSGAGGHGIGGYFSGGSSDGDGYGVYATADIGVGESIGVYGYIDSAITYGVGIRGRATVGIEGQSDSSLGIAGKFNQNNASGHSLYVTGGKSYFENNVGIGTTSPYAKLSVVGSVVATNFHSTSTTLGFKADNLLGGATNLTVDANGNIIRDPSDERLKENIETIVDPLEKIEALRGVTYFWKDKERFGYNQEIGMIAQEVEQVVPQVVSDGGEYKSLNIKNLVALLVEGVKALKQKVDYLFTWFDGNQLKVQGEICVDEVCVSKDEFKALLIDAQMETEEENQETSQNQDNQSETESSEENQSVEGVQLDTGEDVVEGSEILEQESIEENPPESEIEEAQEESEGENGSSDDMGDTSLDTEVTQ